MDACEVVSRGLFVTGGDGTELFDDIEEALDEIAFPVEREIAAPLLLPVRLRRYHDSDVA